MDMLIALFIFVFGLIFGSFFNVVGLRIPQNTFLSSSRSACASCQQTLHWFELIPVFSFLLQQGKCRHCQQKISLLYPIVELITGLGFMLSYLMLGLSIDFILALFLVSLLAIIIVTDYSYMLIPNKILLFFLPVFVLLRIIHPLEPWWSSIIGSAIGFGLLALIILLSKGGMGAGDMKLLGLLGIVLGFPYILLCFFIATLYGLLLSTIVLFKNGFKKKKEVPFGPAIMLGALTTFYFGENMVQAYINLFW
nr:A24 family peptidase [Gracilibacillus massiliensis]